MQLKGSCHCRKVRFTVTADEPYPFNRCYCSICRKTAGSGGYAVNLGAWYNTLNVEGEEFISIYRARIEDPDTGESMQSEGERSFCSNCGSQLWVFDPRWPELVHPHASAIDTPLPVPPEHTHMMMAHKPEWVEVKPGASDRTFDEYPDESLAEWHRRHDF